MKIKVDNIFKKLFYKFNINKNSEQAKVIKFSRVKEDVNTEENI